MRAPVRKATSVFAIFGLNPVAFEDIAKNYFFEAGQVFNELAAISSPKSYNTRFKICFEDHLNGQQAWSNLKAQHLVTRLRASSFEIGSV